jgi:hypothetical protein
MKTDAHPNPEKPTQEWVTGEEPMTGPQISYLQTKYRVYARIKRASYAKRAVLGHIIELGLFGTDTVSVPEGLPIVGRQFIAGSHPNNRPRPVGDA